MDGGAELMGVMRSQDVRVSFSFRAISVISDIMNSS